MRPAQAVAAMDDEVLTAPDRPVVVDVRANDVGADELHVVLTGELAEERGTVSVDEGGLVTYTPPADLPQGFDAATVDYALSLDRAGTQVLDRARLRVLVRPAQQRVLVDDVVVLDPDAERPYVVRVLDNDQGVGNADLWASCVAEESCFVRDRTVRFGSDVPLSPGERFTFRYGLLDPVSIAASGPQEASVTVLMPPTAPVGRAVAVDDRAAVVLGDVVDLEVLGNDTVPLFYEARLVSAPEDQPPSSPAPTAAVASWLHGSSRGARVRQGDDHLPAGTAAVIGVAGSGVETGVSPTATVTVNLTAATANDDVLVLDEAVLGGSVLLDVLANDDAPQDAEALPTSQIAAGPLEWDAGSRAVRLRVDDRALGSQTFTYELRSDDELLDTAQVTVRIRRAAAVADRVAALPGRPVDVAVLGNDRETEGRSVQVPARSEHGTLRWDAVRRVVVYTMDRDWTGPTDRFTYRLGLPDELFVEESSAEVTVERITVPSAPTAVTAERREDGVVVVRWQPPDRDGGSPITGYHVRDGSPEDEFTSVFLSVSATVRSVEVPRSSEVDESTITVTAVNAAGEGPAARVAVLRRPSAPQDLQAVGGPSLVAVQWRPPASQGSSPLTGYRVTWDRAGTAAGGGGSRLLPADASWTVLTGLQDGVAHNVSVEAVNAVGAGPAARTSATPRTPVVVDDRALTTATAPVDVPVLANDRDVAGGVLSVDVLPAGRGRAEVVGGGVRFTPSGPFGRVELTYRLTALGVELGRGTAVVEEVDAVDDTARSPRGRPVTVDLLGNDLVPGGVTPRVVGGAGGTLELDGTGARFTPADGFVGTASVSYELAVDGRALDAGTVRVEVGARPDAVDDTRTAVAGTPVDIVVLDNDVAATGLTVAVVPGPHDRDLQVLPSGVVRYLPPVEQRGPVVFSYALVDATVSYDSATVTVQVEPPRPQAVDDAASTPAQTPVTVDVRANDLHAADTTIRLVPVVPGASVVGGDVRYEPPAGVAGVVTITYGLSRGGPVLTSAQLRVTVGTAPTTGPTTDPTSDPSGTTSDPATSPDPDTGPQEEAQEEAEPTPPADPTADPTPTPTVTAQPTLRPVTVLPGGVVELAGSGCLAGQRVDLVVGDVAAGSVTADRAGRFTAEVRAPADVGRHVVVASCGDRQVRQTVDVVVTVSSAAGGAAATGGALVVAGLLAFYVLTGSVLVPRGTSTGAPAPADED